MLREYETDHKTGMNIELIAKVIYDYTNGYPFLVSRICQLTDSELIKEDRFASLKEAWTEAGISEVVRIILMEKNTLFESLMGKVQNNIKLGKTLQRILFSGEKIHYNAFDLVIGDAEMYGFVYNAGGFVKISNRIFETLLYNFYLTTEEMQNTEIFRCGSS